MRKYTSLKIFVKGNNEFAVRIEWFSLDFQIAILFYINCYLSTIFLFYVNNLYIHQKFFINWWHKKRFFYTQAPAKPKNL